MLVLRSLTLIFCALVSWTLALPRRSPGISESSGAGEIQNSPEEKTFGFSPFDDENIPKHDPFDEYESGSNPSSKEFPEYDIGIRRPPNRPPYDEGHPHEPEEDKFPDYEHEDDESKEPAEEDEKVDHKPPFDEKWGDEEEVQDSEEEKTQDGEEKKNGSEPTVPFGTALFSLKQVNFYIKQLEKAMEHAFHEAIEEASMLNGTFADSSESEVEVDGHKYKVQKSIIETGDADKNSTLIIEAISSEREDEPSKNRTERSNPDAEPYQ